MIAGNLAQLGAHARGELTRVRGQRRRVLQALHNGRRSGNSWCPSGRAHADPAQLIEGARGNGGGVAKLVAHLGIVEVSARGQLREHAAHVGTVEVDRGQTV